MEYGIIDAIQDWDQVKACQFELICRLGRVEDEDIGQSWTLIQSGNARKLWYSLTINSTVVDRNNCEGYKT